MKTHSLRGALRQEVRRAVARQGKAITRRLDRTRAKLRVLRATIRRQSVELARAQRRLAKLQTGRPGAGRRPGSSSGPSMTPRQIRAVRGGRSRRAFAEILGVSANSIFLWETGRARPRGVNLARLERARGPKRGPGRPPGPRPAGKKTGKKTARQQKPRRTAAARAGRRRAAGKRTGARTAGRRKAA